MINKKRESFRMIRPKTLVNWKVLGKNNLKLCKIENF